MARVQTSVMVDEDKRNLAKQKGLKLQDILDHALNMALELEVKGKAQLEIDQNNILKSIELKERETKEYLKEYQNNVDHLEMQKRLFIEKKEHEILELKTQLNMINEQLEKAKEDQSDLNKLNEYKDIIRVASNYGGLNDDIEKQIFDWIAKWGVGYDVTGLFEQINKDLTNVCYRKLMLDDITIDDPVFRSIKDEDLAMPKED